MSTKKPKNQTSEKASDKKARRESEQGSDVLEHNLLSENQGIQSPALWFILLLIPILISLYLAFMRESGPEKIISPKAAVQTEVQTQQQKPTQGAKPLSPVRSSPYSAN